MLDGGGIRETVFDRNLQITRLRALLTYISELRRTDDLWTARLFAASVYITPRSCDAGDWPTEACGQANEGFEKLSAAVIELREVTRRAEAVRLFVIHSILVAACLLYLAFFLTLDSAVVSILEAMASRISSAAGKKVLGRDTSQVAVSEEA